LVRSSKSSQAVSYNPSAIVFGYITATFEWKASGDIQMDIDMMVGGLPFIYLPVGPKMCSTPAG
jgi:hypothetical protein